MMLESAEHALRLVQSGMRVFLGSGAAAPTTLIDALCDAAPSLTNVEICQLLTLGRDPTTEPAHANHFRHNAFFIGESTRSGW